VVDVEGVLTMFVDALEEYPSGGGMCGRSDVPRLATLVRELMCLENSDLKAENKRLVGLLRLAAMWMGTDDYDEADYQTVDAAVKALQRSKPNADG